MLILKGEFENVRLPRGSLLTLSRALWVSILDQV